MGGLCVMHWELCIVLEKLVDTSAAVLLICICQHHHHHKRTPLLLHSDSRLDRFAGIVLYKYPRVYVKCLWYLCCPTAAVSEYLHIVVVLYYTHCIPRRQRYGFNVRRCCVVHRCQRQQQQRAFCTSTRLARLQIFFHACGLSATMSSTTIITSIVLFLWVSIYNYASHK